MQNFNELSGEELSKLQAALQEEYEAWRARGLKLDMSRGKPSPSQLDLSNGLLDVCGSTSDLKSENGVDTRNYGLLEGIPEARKLMAEIMDVNPEQVIVGGNSSLKLMYDAVVRAMLLGAAEGAQPWCQQGTIKFLCPVPGYDRHFAICEQLGIEMIPIPLDGNGPDMDEIERLVGADSAIKGIWCVPKYSNPTGVVYSDAVVDRFARLKPAADDFRIFWDNAYAIHDLYPDAPKLRNIFAACEAAGTQDRVLAFTSTSKISFSGGGLAALAASKRNIALIKKQMSIQTIGFDKVNQLRHARYYKDLPTLITHMDRMADIIRPKFGAVLETLQSELGGTGIAQWTRPLGGYFISVDLLAGCAKRTVSLCREAGVVLTGAGATYPYGIDPKDSNIRIAPTYPEPEELALAAQLFCLCAKMAAVEKLLAAR